MILINKVALILILLLFFVTPALAFIPAKPAIPVQPGSKGTPAKPAIPAERARPHISPTPTPQRYYFNEEFNTSSLDTNIWDVFDNGGSYTLQEGVLTLNPDTNLPFIRAKLNPFPTSGQFMVEYGIKYNEITGKGSGLSLASAYHDNSNIFWQGSNLIATWQDLGDRLSIYQNQSLAYSFGGATTDYLQIKIIYDGAKYDVYLNDIYRYSSSNLSRAISLWFGHPAATSLVNNWTSFSIDYLRITAL